MAKKMTDKITDFGEKIGGARKDLWKSRGLCEDDLEEMNEAEKAKYVKKDNIWPSPNSKKQVEEGLDIFVAFWQREARKKVHQKPMKYKDETTDYALIRFIRIVRLVRDKVMNVKDMNDIYEFYKLTTNYFGESSTDFRICVDTSIAYMGTNHRSMLNKIAQQNFPYGNTRKITNRKKSFVPPQLESIERGGKDYRHGRHIDENIWQNQFSFRGVEFGNWMSQKDRQFSMDYCYDALLDLAEALQISDKDIAFDGTLALAFGARGSSKASAHYEPLRQVINLTKMHGAGSTAHEWMHALDAKISLFYGLDNKLELASANTREWNCLPEEFTSLVKALQKDAEGNVTDYYKGSKKFDKMYAKDSFGYWASPSEMLARAFACYVKDVLGVKSDYLIAHADCYVFEYENQSACAIPQGEEREIFDEMFDRLFFKLKEDGLFKHEEVHEGIKAPEKILINHPEKYAAKDFVYNQEHGGQLSFAL